MPGLNPINPDRRARIDLTTIPAILSREAIIDSSGAAIVVGIAFKI